MRVDQAIGVALITVSLLVTVLVATDAIAPGFLIGAVVAMLGGVAVLVLQSQ